MLNWRLYRAAFALVVVALAVAAFSLQARPQPLTSTLAPDAFNGSQAFAELGSLASEYPDRRPGSSGDQGLASHVASEIRALGGAGGAGFEVRKYAFIARTEYGERTLTTVVAQRPGSTEASPIVILAHRDSAAVGGGRAELSGTAALLELARVFAARETRRAIVLVSTSGGSGGDAGALELASGGAGLSNIEPFDAAIVLGDIASGHRRAPFVVPYSDGSGSASMQLQRTVDYAIGQQTGLDAGAPSVIGQLAHLAFRFTVAEQGPLDAAGIPAVLVQASGERGPAREAPVSSERLEGFGRAVLSAVDALDAAPDVSAGMQTGLVVQHQVIPGWALRLVVLALLLGPALVTLDGLARERLRQRGAGRAIGSWTLWTLACAVPFALAAAFARLLGLSGAIAGAASEPLPPQALSLSAAAVRATAAVALVLALAWLLWLPVMRRLRLARRPGPEVSGLPVLAVGTVVGVATWVTDPVAALLLVPALHLWLLIASPELRPRPLGGLTLIAIALLPLALLLAFYADQLGLGPGALAWSAVLVVAGGHLGIAGGLLWCIAFGCVAAMTMFALYSSPRDDGPADDGQIEITIRGPLSYAGPGSLGGTESALRR